MYGFRNCGLCGKRMSLKYRKKFLTGENIPDNFVMLDINGEEIFAHITCARNRIRALRKDRQLKISGGFNTGVFHIEVEY